MSQLEHLFFDPGHTDVPRAARALASALGMELAEPRTGGIFVGTRELSAGSPVHITGDVKRNDAVGEEPHEPEDTAVYDAMPMVWSLWSADTDEQGQSRLARAVFDLVVSRLAWPCILDHGFMDLLASHDPERGVREFPPGTPSDGTGRHLWA